jgi:prepilin-type N-terminal cleavage/methylation domain-containing protein/prepilin-type processing-associated H-X9-DG protein
MLFVPRARRKGFTLIELLVVIAIIAILAAILFPVFAQAREKARQTTCTSNVKNLGLAVVMYAQDYDETYPPLWYAVGNGHWPNTVRPYIGQGGSDSTGKLWTKGIMVCPSAPLKNPGWSYAMSEALGVYDSKLNGYRAFTLASIARPAGVLMIAEAPQVKEWGEASIQISGDSKCWGGPLGNGVDGLKGYADVDPIPQSATADCSSALPRYRHNGGGVIAWADGHASWRRKGSLRWCRDVSPQEPGADCPQ